MLAIYLTKNFREHDIFTVFALYKREMYNLRRLELARTITLQVLSDDVDENKVSLLLFCTKNKDLLSPGITLTLDKHIFDEVFEKTRRDLNLPVGFDMYKTLEDAVLEVSPSRALLYLKKLKLKEVMPWM